MIYKEVSELIKESNISRSFFDDIMNKVYSLIKMKFLGGLILA